MKPAFESMAIFILQYYFDKRDVMGCAIILHSLYTAKSRLELGWESDLNGRGGAFSGLLGENI